MTVLIRHPDFFKQGPRVIKRVARSKDGAKKRPPKILVSRFSDEYDHSVSTLLADIERGERIYASVDARNEKKAIHAFKQRMLDNDRQMDPGKFFYSLQRTWASCLDSPNCAESSLFLFDLDSPYSSHETELESFMRSNNINEIHRYESKSGLHVITAPFNPSLLPANLLRTLHKNAAMLVAYSKS